MGDFEGIAIFSTRSTYIHEDGKTPKDIIE